MAQTPETRDKISRPHAHYDAPAEVVVDPALSHREKEKALDNLEQDARQLEEADGEGMTTTKHAPEDSANNLHAVLDARGMLELPPIEAAHKLVLKDLCDRLAAGPAEGRALLEQAIAALERLQSPAAAAAPAAAGMPGTAPPAGHANVSAAGTKEKGVP